MIVVVGTVVVLVVGRELQVVIRQNSKAYELTGKTMSVTLWRYNRRLSATGESTSPELARSSTYSFVARRFSAFENFLLLWWEETAKNNKKCARESREAAMACEGIRGSLLSFVRPLMLCTVVLYYGVVDKETTP